MMVNRLNRFWERAWWLAVAGCFGFSIANAGTTNSFPQSAYIWQRAWNSSLTEAIDHYGSNFSELIVLGAEVDWKEKRPRVVRVPINYAALASRGSPIGLALRLGPFSGTFSRTNETTTFLTKLASSLVAEARANGVKPVELQIDFDCADSKLAGYCLWIEALRRRLAPIPLTITTLPSWLGQPGFKQLVAGTDGYVLQVHSLERPRDINAPFTLCEPEAAKRAVERAGGFGVPFRVALPTYGYLIAYDRSGHFVGLSAEGPKKNWPEGVQLREARTNPNEVAQLVQTWLNHTPEQMRGIIWYRFPVANDTLNLHWPTLDAMMHARSPRQSLRVEPRRVEQGLVEINLENNGELDTSSRLAIEVRWSHEGGIRLVAGDGLRGFEMVDAGPSIVRFQTRSQACRLTAGEKLVIGWLRLSDDREVQVELKQL